MKLKTFPVNPFEMNCYIYHDENSHECVIIDPGMYTDEEKNKIKQYINSEKIGIKYILLTHGHIDHIMGCKWAKDTYDVPLLMYKDDLPLVRNAIEQGKLFNVVFPEPPDPDKFIAENEKIKFGNCTLKILHTPGHSPGGICFVDEENKNIFVGDTIFKNSIGRTDLWKGDMNTLLNSIQNKIFQYSDDYVLYPGHYEPTTIGEEKLTNPFLN
jgi:glyoxylase-like metal-dependent hydrolase (beta-lactamase superfamily II)